MTLVSPLMGLQIGPSTKQVDYLVIGSGFGGSVMTATLAEAGKNVCLFERGKAYPPGSFPRGSGLGTNFWDPVGNWHGMYDVRSFEGIDAVVASGLGGGSLIYANVMLEKPSSWYEQPNPGTDDPNDTETWRFTHNDLRDHIDEVKKVLRVQTLPREFETTVSPKTGRLKTASPDTTESAPLAVRFRCGNDDDPAEPPSPGTALPTEVYGNIHGDVVRTTCTMCAECDIGCNDGAKSSMDHTYLSKASADGAEICIRTEVRQILRRAPGSEYLFDVLYVVHSDAGESAVRTIQAKRVILAAGTFGSTHLMLDNASRLNIPIEDQATLGTRFCGNGDLLGFAIPKADGQDENATKGPVITTYRRYLPGQAGPFEPRIFVQDGGIPNLKENLKLSRREILELIQKWCKFLADKRADGGNRTLVEETQESLSIVRRLLTMLPLLGMGADVANGKLTIDNARRLQCSWTLERSLPHFAVLEEQLEQLNKDLGTDYVVNPQFPFRQRVITVHPLGGCPADTTKTKGVVDSYGRVRAVPGLWITDGSVMPGPVGANPSLTIAAFASRAAEELLREKNLATPSTPVPFTPS